MSLRHDWSVGGHMRDCIEDWREEIAEGENEANHMIWIQAWQLESLLDRIASLEVTPENGSEK